MTSVFAQQTRASSRVLLGLLLLAISAGSRIAAGQPVGATAVEQARLIAWTNFSAFDWRTNAAGDPELTSPRVGPGFAWEELIVSWNVVCPPGGWLRLEARGLGTNEGTRFYTLARWSAARSAELRTSVPGQKDAAGDVLTDTLVLKSSLPEAQIRFVLGSTNDGTRPMLKLVTASFWRRGAVVGTNGINVISAIGPLDVPERRQTGWPSGEGWCSPTSVAMVLAWWGRQLGRAELDLTVPAVADAVDDPQWSGTGNWVFNTAFAGGFPGMRAYVARFRGVSDLGPWLAAGIPVITSVSFDYLQGREHDEGNGHLIVVVGFTDTGDVIINDPWPNPKRENRVRKVVPRSFFERAWRRSHQAVYLIYPESVLVPRPAYGLWLE